MGEKKLSSSLIYSTRNAILGTNFREKVDTVRIGCQTSALANMYVKKILTGRTRSSPQTSMSIRKDELVELKRTNSLYKRIIEVFLGKESGMDLVFKYSWKLFW